MVNKYLKSGTLGPSCRGACGGQATGCVHLVVHLELASSRSTHRPNSNKWLERPSLVKAPLTSSHHALLFSEAATPAAPIGPVVVCGSFSIHPFLVRCVSSFCCRRICGQHRRSCRGVPQVTFVTQS